MNSVGVSLSAKSVYPTEPMTLEEKRRSTILNVILITTLAFLGAQLVFFTSSTDNVGVIIYLVALTVWELTVLYLNLKKKHVLARLLFLISAYPVLLSLPIYFGESSHFHYYLFPASGMPLIFFKNEIGKWKWLLSLIAFPCWFYIEWHFANFEGLFAIPDSILAGFQFYNETLVIITATVMFAVFTRESDAQIEKIEDQNVKLTAFEEARTKSIQYANKIQRSIFPSQEKLDALFPNSFVYYRPKDIIGGDFYWVKQIGNTRFLATADCTGHGVPGALLSMMIQSHLEAIVTKETQITGEILAELHVRVLSSFKTGQHQSTTEDGCDMSLVKLTNEGSLEFAGSNGSIYYFENGEVKKVKGDSASIGGSNIFGEVIPNQTYKSQQLNLSKGTPVYLMTDGILDVMNVEHQDFGSYQLKAMLANLEEKESFQSVEFIEQNINEFRGESALVDDVLIVGFSVP